MKLPSLHKSHLYADAAIGAIAISTVILGDEAFSFFARADLVFHIVIAVLAFGGIAAERLLHRSRHV
jgi:hypothetical protein